MPASMKRRGLRGIMGSHSRFTAPCTWQRKPSLAYSSARTTPDLASRRDARTSCVLFPIEETTPMPITTTRLIEGPQFASACRVSMFAVAARPRARQSRGGRLLARAEQPHAQVRGCKHHLAVGLHDTIGDRKLELAQDH